MIELHEVSKVFHSRKGEIRALHNISLTVQQGEIMGIVGASGAGKSTLLRCVNLLERPTGGEVLVDGQCLNTLNQTELRQARRNIGMIFQQFNLLDSKTVYDNIALPLVIAGKSKTAIDEKVKSLSNLTGIQDKLNRTPRELSGGQKQRVAIARALATDSKVLLCDEATSSLDPETTKSILTLLESLRTKLNVTILLITHEMDVVKSICDRLAIIEGGELVEQAGVGEFFSDPKTTLAKTFVHNTLKQRLPAPMKESLQQTMQAGFVPLLRLWFFQGTASEPTLARAAKRFEVEVNIVQANLEYVQHHVMGILVLTLGGQHDKCDEAIAFFVSEGVRVEQLGYIPDSPAVFEEL
jgi:D-methionine transport system ATP-binding protein